MHRQLRAPRPFISHVIPLGGFFFGLGSDGIDPSNRRWLVHWFENHHRSGSGSSRTFFNFPFGERERERARSLVVAAAAAASGFTGIESESENAIEVFCLRSVRLEVRSAARRWTVSRETFPESSWRRDSERRSLSVDFCDQGRRIACVRRVDFEKQREITKTRICASSVHHLGEPVVREEHDPRAELLFQRHPLFDTFRDVVLLYGDDRRHNISETRFQDARLTPAHSTDGLLYDRQLLIIGGAQTPITLLSELHSREPLHPSLSPSLHTRLRGGFFRRFEDRLDFSVCDLTECFERGYGIRSVCRLPQARGCECEGVNRRRNSGNGSRGR